MIQGSPSGNHRYIAHSRESSLNPVVREILRFVHSDGYTPYGIQKPFRP